MAIKTKPELIKIESCEQNYLKRNIRKTFSTPYQWQALPDMWHWLARKYTNKIAVIDPHHLGGIEYNFFDLSINIDKFASGLQYLGVKPNDKISFFAENGARWLIADQGIMKTGAINAVRSSSAPIKELIYILKQSESKGLIVETQELYNKLESHINSLNLDFVILLYGRSSGEGNIFSYEQIMQFGSNNVFIPVQINKSDPATIVYTSGTTGKPKGAVLTHGNLLHQVHKFALSVKAKSSDTALSILPIWHAYERTCDYFLFSRGSGVVYTNLRNFKQDLQKYKPTYLITVPRILDSVYESIIQEIDKQSKIKQFIFKATIKAGHKFILSVRTFNNLNLNEYKPDLSKKIIALVNSCLLLPLYKIFDQLIYKKIRKVYGENINTIISGGGALSAHLEDFYETVGINILVGYGLTETSPVLTVRNPARNLRGSVGQPLENTQIKIVNPKTGDVLPTFSKGLVLVKGPQIMLEYYNDIEATNKVIDDYSWFNTGDFGWLTDKNDLILTGRLKDLIVLSNGEKVEPIPIEEACQKSPFIKQIMLIGQDKRSLSALIIPDIDNLRTIKEFNEVDENSLNEKKIINFFLKEVNYLVKHRQNARSYEQISNLRIIYEEFSVENGLLTQTLKIRRSSVMERYSDLICELYK